MSLSEADIQRYARHILLPEVGGRGQERLLASEIRISGSSSLVDLTGSYLRAAGVVVDAHSGRGLHLFTDNGVHVVISVVSAMSDATRESKVEIRRSTCERCAGVATSAGEFDVATGMIAASLAANECLLAILGLGGAERVWEVQASEVRSKPLERCEAHR